MMRALKKLFGRAQTGKEEFEILLGGNADGLNVLVLTEYINATYYISFDIPFRLMHADGQINLAVASQNFVANCGEGCWERWSRDYKPDVVIMTRYGHKYGINILKYFKSSNIPVIYHIDDDLINLPDSLGSEIRKRQGAKGVVETREYLLGNCDLIYASTSYLAGLMQKRFRGQQVFQGIYAPYMRNKISIKNHVIRDVDVIGYMGSKGHQHDLDLVVPALERLLAERETLEFEVFGTIKMPEKLERFGHRVRGYSVQKSYAEFLSNLASLGWSIGLAPLVDLEFNRCKAPTKFIEYTACGIPVVASDISVYSEVVPAGGAELVKDDWYGAITKYLDDRECRNKALCLSQEYCEETFAPPVLVKQLSDVIYMITQNRIAHS